MIADEYRAALAAIGLKQQVPAKLLGIDGRTVQRWAAGERDVPPPAARFLRYLVHVGADLARVRAILESFEAQPRRTQAHEASLVSLISLHETSVPLEKIAGHRSNGQRGALAAAFGSRVWVESRGEAHLRGCEIQDRLTRTARSGLCDRALPRS